MQHVPLARQGRHLATELGQRVDDWRLLGWLGGLVGRIGLGGLNRLDGVTGVAVASEVRASTSSGVVCEETSSDMAYLLSSGVRRADATGRASSSGVGSRRGQGATAHPQ